MFGGGDTLPLLGRQPRLAQLVVQLSQPARCFGQQTLVLLALGLVHLANPGQLGDEAVQVAAGDHQVEIGGKKGRVFQVQPPAPQKVPVAVRIAEQQNLQPPPGRGARRQDLPVGGKNLLDPHDRAPGHRLVGRALQRKPIPLILPINRAVAADRRQAQVLHAPGLDPARDS